MFAFLQPIWLFALGGVAVPIIIHLWNQRPGRVLKVGSVAWVTANPQRYKANIRLKDFLLLVIRCLLIATVCMALAGLVWKRSSNTSGKGWVLLSREDLPAGYHHFKRAIDSLITAGFEFHLFEEGFSKIKLEEALAQPNDTIPRFTSYRQLAALLNEQVNADLPLFIFSNNYLRNFNGERTAVSLNLHWMFYTADTTRVQPGADTAKLRVTIFTKQYLNDARYIQAALQAVQQYTKRNITTSLVSEIKNIPLQQDWLVWLADSLPPPPINASHLLYYANGKQQNLSSVILPAGNSLFEAVSLRKRIAGEDTLPGNDRLYWQDGFGHPLLIAKQMAKQTQYALTTHIDPAWNDLPWNENFPLMLYRLLYPVSENDLPGNRSDKTIIDPKQAMPLVLPVQKTAVKPLLFEQQNLSAICWLIAFIVLCAERALSFHLYQTKENG